MSNLKIATGTKNPCNEFLVRQLIKLRGKGDKKKCDHRFFMYSAAIQSIRKYPLPIICSQQLLMLAGIGEYLTKELTETIKQHYKKYLKTTQEDESSKINLSQTLSQGNQSCSQNISQPSLTQYDYQSQMTLSQYQDDIGDDLSINSEKSPVAYKPRANTQPYNILIAMKTLQAESKSVTKSEINAIMSELQLGAVKNWATIKATLINAGYAMSDPESKERLFITQKALLYLSRTNKKVTTTLAQKKRIKEEVEAFKRTITQGIIHQLPSIKQSEYSQTFVGSKNALIVSAEHELKLIIDSREMKDHSDKEYFQEKLIEKYSIKCETSALSVGDFAWMYGNQVLDFLVQRKKADDLAASILDGRYKEQKYRLKSSGVSKIFYLYQGHPSATCVKSEKQLENALLKTRMHDNFKVVKTKAINESAKFISQIHAQIVKKIEREGDQMQTLGTLNQFNKRNSKSKNLTLEAVFGLCLKTFPNVGKQTVNSLLHYFKTFTALRNKLSQFQLREQRIQFLNTLLKGGRTQASVIRMLVDFLFSQRYD